jgi:hypothetical protein
MESRGQTIQSASNYSLSRKSGSREGSNEEREEHQPLRSDVVLTNMKSL